MIESGQFQLIANNGSNDPQSDGWRGYGWILGVHFEAATGVMIPMDQGIYRLRCAGLDGLAYVGIRVNLRKRLRGLRRGRSNPPDYLGHSASGCLAEIQRRHHAQIEVSFVTMVGTKPKELKGS